MPNMANLAQLNIYLAICNKIFAQCVLEKRFKAISNITAIHLFFKISKQFRKRKKNWQNSHGSWRVHKFILNERNVSWLFNKFFFTNFLINFFIIIMQNIINVFEIFNMVNFFPFFVRSRSTRILIE